MLAKPSLHSSLIPLVIFFIQLEKKISEFNKHLPGLHNNVQTAGPLLGHNNKYTRGGQM